MKLSAPTQALFIVAVIFALLALLGFFGVLAPVVGYSFWLMTIAFGVLAFGCLFRGA